MEGDELFKKIREGSEEEAREAYNRMRKNNLRHAALAIITRNLSHNAGAHVAEALKRS
jgi:hypothetical protein